jgi:hypothetical protein
MKPKEYAALSMIVFSGLIILGCSLSQATLPILAATQTKTSSPLPAITVAEPNALSPTKTVAQKTKLAKTVVVTIKPTMNLTLVGAGKTLIGKWERHGIQSAPYTEKFILSINGTYTIEARFDETGEVLAENHGTFTFNDTSYTATDKDQRTFTEHYVLLDGGSTLVIENQMDKAWKRMN